MVWLQGLQSPYTMLKANRRVTVALALTACATLCVALNPDHKKEEAPAPHAVGYSVRQFTPGEDYNWRGSQDHTLSAIVWYPSEDTTEEEDQYIGPPDAPLFYAGRVAKDATFAPSFGQYPLLALSHGTGGSALQMAWLATYLAARGYIVVAVNHPGNNAVTGYAPQGFVEGWERAKDISTAISALLADPRFGPKIDPGRIGAAGFSFGGYTMMELAGATTDFPRLLAWCNEPNHNCNVPEMPDLMQKFKAIQQQPELQKDVQNGVQKKSRSLSPTPPTPTATRASEPSSQSPPPSPAPSRRKVSRRSRSP